MKKLTSIILASSVVCSLVGSGVALTQTHAAQVTTVKHNRRPVAVKKTVAKVATIKAAITYIMKSSVNTKYRYAEYRFNTKTTYQGQTAYLINVIAKGSKTVTAKYYVLANGNIVAVPTAKSVVKPVAKPAATKVNTIDGAVKYAMAKLNNKYPYAKYHFVEKKVVNGQTAYVIDVTTKATKGVKSVTTSYNVLANGTLLKN